ncbi:MAG: hypothetical protein ACRET2_10920, partial [Steroidobacteraceae bacterium]
LRNKPELRAVWSAAAEQMLSRSAWRTFSWLGRNRRLAKNFENLAVSLATFVTLASIQLALRRLARA